MCTAVGTSVAERCLRGAMDNAGVDAVLAGAAEDGAAGGLDAGADTDELRPAAAAPLSATAKCFSKTMCSASKVVRTCLSMVVAVGISATRAVEREIEGDKGVRKMRCMKMAWHLASCFCDLLSLGSLLLLGTRFPLSPLLTCRVRLAHYLEAIGAVRQRLQHCPESILQRREKGKSELRHFLFVHDTPGEGERCETTMRRDLDTDGWSQVEIERETERETRKRNERNREIEMQVIEREKEIEGQKGTKKESEI